MYLDDQNIIITLVITSLCNGFDATSVTLVNTTSYSCTKTNPCHNQSIVCESSNGCHMSCNTFDACQNIVITTTNSFSLDCTSHNACNSVHFYCNKSIKNTNPISCNVNVISTNPTSWINNNFFGCFGNGIKLCQFRVQQRSNGVVFRHNSNQRRSNTH